MITDVQSVEEGHTVGTIASRETEVKRGRRRRSRRKELLTNKRFVFSDEVLWYENYDLDNIVTPVRAEVLKEMLEKAHYDEDEILFLYKGFTEGFSLGYQGSQDRRTLARNHKLRAGNQTVLWNKLMGEVKLKRVVGPWHEENIPFSSFIQSPITLIKKKGQEHLEGVEGTRLIFDLSYPRGDSLNDHTPKSVKKR